MWENEKCCGKKAVFLELNRSNYITRWKEKENVFYKKKKDKSLVSEFYHQNVIIFVYPIINEQFVLDLYFCQVRSTLYMCVIYCIGSYRMVCATQCNIIYCMQLYQYSVTFYEFFLKRQIKVS